MSNYNKTADTAQEQLDKISKSMCFAKWAQVSMHFTNGMTHSCYHPPLHKISIDDIKRNPGALHNTKQKKKERRLMLQGKRPQGCHYCWKIEDSGARSDRIYRSGEYWAQNAKDDILNNLDSLEVDPRYLEVNFNQACNFKCMYCSPHLSTTWEEEINNLGPIHVYNYDGDLIRHNDLEYLAKDGLMPIKISGKENPYLTAFWQWWPQLYKKLEVFRITGGEPLMDNNLYRVLDYVYANPNSWLELSITSNFCPPKAELLDKFIHKVKRLEEIKIWEDKERFNPNSGNNWYVSMPVKNFALFISIDSVGSQAEYIRTGLDFKILNHNIDRFLGETINTTITFINTFNVLSVPKIKDFLAWILELRKKNSKLIQGVKTIPINDPYYPHPDHVIEPKQRVWFDIPLLRNPEWQSIHVLPISFEKYFIEALDFMKTNANIENFIGFYDFEIAKLERNYKIFKEGASDLHRLETARRNFYTFFSQYDQRRDLKFVKVFPELKKFYKSLAE